MFLVWGQRDPALKTNLINTWLLKHSVLFPNVVVILCLVGFEKSVLPPPQMSETQVPSSPTSFFSVFMDFSVML